MPEGEKTGIIRTHVEQDNDYVDILEGRAEELSRVFLTRFIQ